MSLNIRDATPEFTADTSTGKIHLHDWIDGDWVSFFSHSGDFTPVCTTEVGRTAGLADAFANCHVQPLCLSTDAVPRGLGITPNAITSAEAKLKLALCCFKKHPYLSATTLTSNSVRMTSAGAAVG